MFNPNLFLEPYHQVELSKYRIWVTADNDIFNINFNMLK